MTRGVPGNPAIGPVSPARTVEEVRGRHEANRVAWNQAAEQYAREVDQTIQFIREGRSNLHPLERANLGDLRTWCKTAIHLQCASGRDTLSLWVEGAQRVVGVDISDGHIANARKTSEAVGAPAAWYRCDVLDTPTELNGTADLVYTGRGAMCWIHDLDAWAAVVYRLLRPGGVIHVLDSHPVLWLFDLDAEEFVCTGFDYFRHAESNRGWPVTYLGDMGLKPEQHAIKYEQAWTLGAIFTALRRAGLVIEHLGEHPEGFYADFPYLRPELRGRLPMTFTMMARRPKG
jgi:SAM-dependent methyltransferase